MSHSQFQSSIFTLRHAWLNLWDERMTTGRINQVASFPWHRDTTTTMGLPRESFSPSWYTDVFANQSQTTPGITRALPLTAFAHHAMAYQSQSPRSSRPGHAWMGQNPTVQVRNPFASNPSMRKSHHAMPQHCCTSGNPQRHCLLRATNSNRNNRPDANRAKSPTS